MAGSSDGGILTEWISRYLSNMTTVNDHGKTTIFGYNVGVFFGFCSV